MVSGLTCKRTQLDPLSTAQSVRLESPLDLSKTTQRIPMCDTVLECLTSGYQWMVMRALGHNPPRRKTLVLQSCCASPRTRTVAQVRSEVLTRILFISSLLQYHFSPPKIRHRAQHKIVLVPDLRAEAAI